MAIALGVVIGVTLGLLGGGGSILTVPIFVYVLGFGAKEAIAMSLAVVGVTSLVGTAGHWRAGNVNLRVAAVFGSVAMLGTYAGAKLATRLSGTTQLAIFAVVMLVAAAFMFRDRGRAPAAAPSRAPTRGGAMMALVVIEGLAVGLLTGVVGVGGGFLIVPALVLLALPMREAVGTSLAIIATNCVVGFWGYLGHVAVDWRAIALVTAGTIPGTSLGVYLHRRVPQQTLRLGFSVFLLLVAVFILYQNLLA
ncbi:MAG: sulfite exporter TauE/SafE family protein [Vicinamibacterales bacterium]